MQLIKPLFFIAFTSFSLLSACGGESESTAENQAETIQPKTSNDDPASETTETVQAAPMPVVNRGEALFKRCKTCHTLNEGGAHKTGPNLHGIFGATAGSKDGFRYSKVMRESGVVWTDENLTAYIKNPAKFMPRNTMSFAGIRKDEDLVQLLDYMRSEIEQ